MPIPARFHFFIAAVTVLLGYPCIDGVGQPIAFGAPTWEERFRKEAPPAWDNYRARAKRFQGSVSVTIFSSPPAKRVTDRSRCEIKQREGCAFYLEQWHTEQTEKGKMERPGRLAVINPRYAFELRRQPPNEAWAIGMVAPNSNKKDLFRDPPIEKDEQWSTIPINFGLIYPSLGVIPNEPGFALQRVTSEIRDGRELAKVEFEYRPQGGNLRLPSLTGWVLYDPGRYWVIVAYDLRVAWAALQGKGGTKLATYDYQDAEDGFPIPKRIVTRFIRPELPSDVERNYELDFREADVPESDFTLSAFGLPEPKGVAPLRSSRWYLWFIAAGVVSLAMGGFFWRRARQRNMVSERPPGT